MLEVTDNTGNAQNGQSESGEAARHGATAAQGPSVAENHGSIQIKARAELSEAKTDLSPDLLDGDAIDQLEMIASSPESSMSTSTVTLVKANPPQKTDLDQMQGTIAIVEQSEQTAAMESSKVENNQPISHEAASFGSGALPYPPGQAPHGPFGPMQGPHGPEPITGEPFVTGQSNSMPGGPNGTAGTETLGFGQTGLGQTGAISQQGHPANQAGTENFMPTAEGAAPGGLSMGDTGTTSGQTGAGLSSATNPFGPDSALTNNSTQTSTALGAANDSALGQQGLGQPAQLGGSTNAQEETGLGTSQLGMQQGAGQPTIGTAGISPGDTGFTQAFINDLSGAETITGRGGPEGQAGPGGPGGDGGRNAQPKPPPPPPPPPPPEPPDDMMMPPDPPDPGMP